MSDLRSLPDAQFNLYAYAYGAWGIALLVLYGFGWLGVALTLCYVVALFVGVITLWWARDLLRKRDDGKLERHEVDAGVKSVGHMLSFGALMPAIVFIARDPLVASTWVTCLSVATWAGLTYALVSVTTRMQNRVGNTVALVLAWAALPLNTTGAASVWTWLGVVG